MPKLNFKGLHYDGLEQGGRRASQEDRLLIPVVNRFDREIQF